ncbi:MAG: helix-turn-helix domain-containing protein [Bacteroidota bacterium]
MIIAEERFQTITELIMGRVRTALAELNWSQAELARRMGKSAPEISKWLSGKHNISLRTLAKLEAVLGLEMVQIVPPTPITPLSREVVLDVLGQFFAAREDIVKAELFGSFARNEEDQSSDLDLLLTFREGASVTLITLSGLRIELVKLLQREVDVIDQRMLRPDFKSQIESEKILLYEQEV